MSLQGKLIEQVRYHLVKTYKPYEQLLLAARVVFRQLNTRSTGNACKYSVGWKAARDNAAAIRWRYFNVQIIITVITFVGLSRINILIENPICIAFAHDDVIDIDKKRFLSLYIGFTSFYLVGVVECTLLQSCSECK